MRILILSWRDLKNPLAGGSEVFVQNLARCWAQVGHKVTFLSSAHEGLAVEEEVDGYQIVRRGGRFTVYRCARRYYQNEGRRSFDAVLEVVNTRPFLTPKWLHDIPVVTLIHQLAREVWKYEVPAPAAVLGRYYLEPRWLRNYADRPVLTLSKSSKASLHDYGMRNVDVIKVGIDPPLNRPLPAKAEKPTVLFVGRLSANKRPEHAVTAHAIARQVIPDLELWVIGDGPYVDKVKSSAGPGVKFFGRVDPETKQDMMASAHALLVTSVREGWGLVVSEAGQVGTRSIGYDVAGLQDSVPAAGGRIVLASPESMANAIVESVPTWMKEGPAQLASLGVHPWEDCAEDVLRHLSQARD